MHIVTSRPSAVRVRLAGRPVAPASIRRQILTAVDVIVRGFFVGVALGMFVVSQGHAILATVVSGIAAIGIALVSWDP